jgi:hypothetical protein
VPLDPRLNVDFFVSSFLSSLMTFLNLSFRVFVSVYMVWSFFIAQ